MKYEKEKRDKNFINYILGSIALFMFASAAFPKIFSYLLLYVEKFMPIDNNFHEASKEWEPDIVKTNNLKEKKNGRI